LLDVARSHIEQGRKIRCVQCIHVCTVRRWFLDVAKRACALPLAVLDMKGREAGKVVEAEYLLLAVAHVPDFHKIRPEHEACAPIDAQFHDIAWEIDHQAEEFVVGQEALEDRTPRVNGKKLLQISTAETLKRSKCWTRRSSMDSSAVNFALPSNFRSSILSFPMVHSLSFIENEGAHPLPAEFAVVAIEDDGLLGEHILSHREALAYGGRIDLAGKFGRGRAERLHVLGEKDKSGPVFENEIEGFLKILIGLAGKTNDEVGVVGRERKVGQERVDCLQVLARIGAPHQPEDLVRGGLYGKVQMPDAVVADESCQEVKVSDETCGVEVV